MRIRLPALTLFLGALFSAQNQAVDLKECLNAKRDRNGMLSQAVYFFVFSAHHLISNDHYITLVPTTGTYRKIGMGCSSNQENGIEMLGSVCSSSFVENSSLGFTFQAPPLKLAQERRVMPSAYGDELCWKEVLDILLDAYEVEVCCEYTENEENLSAEMGTFQKLENLLRVFRRTIIGN